jgi:hypothetical protein
MGPGAAERTGPGQSKVVGMFDPAAEETLFIPRLKAGGIGDRCSAMAIRVGTESARARRTLNIIRPSAGSN